MIDPITKYLLESYGLDTILEGYDLKSEECGRIIKMVKDGSGPLECCNRRMFVMSSQPEPEDVAPMEESTADFSPDNQAEVQDETEEERKKVKKTGLLGDMKYYYGDKNPKKVSEAGFETKPKGWTDASVKKYGKSLVKGGGTKEGFFDKCVKKMKDKMDNPEGFCASIKDEAHDSTYWRGKDKSPQEVGKDVKKHKNV